MISPSQVIVIGGGKMGAGICTTFLLAGHSVLLVEADAHRAKIAAQEIVTDVLNRNGGQPGEVPFTSQVGLTGAPAAALVIETVPESVPLKISVLREAEEFVAEGGLLCSNTSSLSVNKLAAGLARPAQFLGMHFFQPVPDARLVELVTSEFITESSSAQAQEWVRSLGREAIVVRDSPGFATSRLGVAIGLEAMRMVQDGIASAEDIDKGMILGYQHGVGPLRMTDLVGLDVRLAISENLAAELGPRFEPPQILRDKVAAGELGQKSGRGFFDWS